MTRQRRRRFWLALHRWLGLSAGLAFALLGLTGSILCFYQEIDLLLNPLPRPMAAVTADYRWQPVADALRANYPDYAGPWRIEVPLAAGRPIVARYYRPPERAGRIFAPRLVALDPTTLAVVQDRYWGDFAMTWLFDLHYTLLAGATGRVVLAWCGSALLVLLGIGLWLWWPAPGRWRERLRLQLRPGRVRATYDLHVLSGVYGLPLLLVLVVTGIVLEVPDTVQPAVELLGPLTKAPDALPAGPAPLSLDAALAVARARFPDGRPRWLETPARHGGVTRIRLERPGEPSRRFPQSTVWVGAAATPLAVRDIAADSPADRFMAWQHPLHNGEAFGLPGRIAVALAGLLPLLLFVSGLLRWRQKRAARAGRD